MIAHYRILSHVCASMVHDPPALRIFVSSDSCFVVVLVASDGKHQSGRDLSQEVHSWVAHGLRRRHTLPCFQTCPRSSYLIEWLTVSPCTARAHLGRVLYSHRAWSTPQCHILNVTCKSHVQESHALNVTSMSQVSSAPPRLSVRSGRAA